MKHLVLVAALCGTAHAWEAETTHAGLTEQAALASDVHKTLVEGHGREMGWFEPLTVTPATAPALYTKIKRLAPSGGFVPDARGRQTALGWLVAGSVLEDIPPSRARNHFYDPVHRTGLTGRAAGLATRLLAVFVRERASGGGRGAPDWIAARENDLGLERFLAELELSVTARTRVERDTHLAFALVCAGAMAHVLEDVGSPSRARNDYAEHLAELGGGSTDRGSRFERLAALAYGRLGIPAPASPVKRARWRDFFSAADGKGLADVTAARWYSSGTLPADQNVSETTPQAAAQAATRTAAFPSPRPSALPLELARAPDGARVASEDGVCLAHVARHGEHLTWLIPDACAEEQIAAILPEAGSYAAGFLGWLFRGSLVVDPAASVSAGEVALGAGKLEILAENAAGERTALGPTLAVQATAANTPLAAVPAAPAGTTRLLAIFRGVDAHGEAIVAVGAGKP